MKERRKSSIVGYCNYCGNKFVDGSHSITKKYCSIKCQTKKYYKENRDVFLERVKAWRKLNPDKAKQNSKNSFEKFRKERPERFKELMKKEYQRNKKKHYCRTLTNWMILNNKIVFDRRCKICSSDKDLEVHHEIYPQTSLEIIRAVKEGKIYLLCFKHHIDQSAKNRKI